MLLSRHLGWMVLVVVAAPAVGSSHGDISLFVPDIMVDGQTYEGMVLLGEPRSGSYPVLLASGGGATVPEMVVIEPGTNHAVFEVVPAAVGPSVISAVPPDGGVISASYEVFPGAGPRIRMVAPSGTDGTLRTAAGEVPLLVYLADHLGRPVAAGEPVPVYLDASPAIRLPAGLAIPANRTHVPVMMHVHGDGLVHASSPGMAGDALGVVVDGDGVAVRVGVAPNPAPPGSAAAWFVWLERDGMAHVPDGTRQVYVTSSEPMAADTRPAGVPGESRPRLMADGLLQGTLYTGPPPAPDDLRGSPTRTTITATIPGVGSVSVLLGMGPQPAGALAELAGAIRGCLDGGNGTGVIWRGPCGLMLQAFGELGGRVLSGTGSDPATLYLGEAGHRTVQDVRAAMRVSGVERPADVVRLWAFPDVPSPVAWVVAGFYSSVPGLPEMVVPARPLEPSGVVLSHDPGAALPDVGPAGGPALMLVEAAGPLNITISGRGLEPASVRVAGQSGDGHRLRVLAAPSLVGSGVLGMVRAAAVYIFS